MHHNEIEFTDDRWHDDGGPVRAEEVMNRTAAVEAIKGVNPAVKPSGTGCVECLASGKGWWLHLRRCAECGHIGCCNDSPKQHAQAHFVDTHHPIIQSFEPGEDWFYDYTHPESMEPVPAGTTLAAPHEHPKSQAVPFTVPATHKSRKAA